MICKEIKKLIALRKYRQAILKDPMAYLYLPNEDKSVSLSRLAVKKKGSLLENVPAFQRNHLVCFYAVKNDPNALWAVPPCMRTRNLIRLAFRNVNFSDK